MFSHSKSAQTVRLLSAECLSLSHCLRMPEVLALGKRIDEPFLASYLTLKVLLTHRAASCNSFLRRLSCRFSLFASLVECLPELTACDLPEPEYGIYVCFFFPWKRHLTTGSLALLNDAFPSERSISHFPMQNGMYTWASKTLRYFPPGVHGEIGCVLSDERSAASRNCGASKRLICNWRRGVSNVCWSRLRQKAAPWSLSGRRPRATFLPERHLLLRSTSSVPLKAFAITFHLLSWGKKFDQIELWKKNSEWCNFFLPVRFYRCSSGTIGVAFFGRRDSRAVCVPFLLEANSLPFIFVSVESLGARSDRVVVTASRDHTLHRLWKSANVQMLIGWINNWERGVECAA